MADRDLTFKVSARDEASTVFSKASRNIKNALKGTQDDLDDTATAGKRAADVIGAALDELEAELTGTERVVAGLTDKLGPDFANKTDGINTLVDRLRRAGLSFEEIEADIDAFADQIRRADDLTDRLGRTAVTSGDQVARIGDRADQSSSVVANFAGNAAQDIGQIGGAAGTAGVALGQLIEYAADGNIPVRSLVTTFLGLGAAAVVIQGVTGEITKQREAAERHRETVREIADAIREGEDAVTAMSQRWAELGKVDVPLPDWLGGGDLADELDRLGMNVEQFMALAGDTSRIDAWAASMREAGASEEDLAAIAIGAASANGQLAESEELAARNTRIFGDTTEDADRQTRNLNSTLRTTAETLDRVNDAQRARVEGVLSQIDAERQLEESMRTTHESVLELDRVYADSESSAEDRQRALDDAINASIRLGDDWVAAAEAQNGDVALSADETARIQRDALASVADDLAPGNPLLTALNGYIARIDAIPRQISTDVALNFSSNGLDPRFIGSGTPLLLTGPQASGGPRPSVPAFGPVNERGVEMFRGADGSDYLLTTKPGQVVPNDQLAAAGGSSITVNMYGVTVEQAGREAADRIRWELIGLG